MKTFCIFDLDGTLINTISDLGASTNFALKEHGYPVHNLNAYNYMVGNGVRKLLERAAPDADPNKIDEMLCTFKQHYDQHCTDTSKPYPGIKTLLEELQDNDIKFAVATNKYQSAAEKIISTCLPEFKFTNIFGQIPDRPVKPDPSVIFAALNDNPTPKSEVLYIGDSAVDIETARRACVESIGVTWGFRPVSELRKACADHVVSSPAEILKFIDSPY